MKKLILILTFVLGLLLFFSAADQVSANHCTPSTYKHCFETYSEACTTEDGRPGTQICHKQGCSPDGKPGPACTFGDGSYCEPCKANDEEESPPPNTGACTVTENPDVGYCSTEGGVGTREGFCNTYCNASWPIKDPADPEGDNLECKTLKCSCGNAAVCCRRRPDQPTEPPTRPPTRPPTQPPTDRPTEPPTQPPTPTATPTIPPPPTAPPTPTEIPPTPTPTIIILTATPTPPIDQQNAGDSRTPSTPGFVWVCLKSEPYDGPTGSPQYTDHKLKLSGNLPEAVKTTYIAGCVETEQNINCTTGEEAADRKLRISKLPEHEFKLLSPETNPFEINSDKIENVIVYSRTESVLTHKFYAVFENTAENLIDTESTIQYGDIIFRQGEESECVLIMWDPQGQVLEYPSLSPVAEVELTLLSQRGEKIKLPGLRNPLRTDREGRFDFLVPDGKYKLEVKVPEGFKIVENPSITSLAYLPEKSFVYKKGMVIDTKERKDYQLIILLQKKNLWDKLKELISSLAR